LIAEISTNSEVTEATVAYYNFIQGKERAGIERAVLSNTFGRGKFAQGMFAKFITLIAEQKTYFNSFNTFTSAEDKRFFEQQMNDSSVDEVIRLRQIAEDKLLMGEFGVDAEYWFKQATNRIGQIKKIENHLSAALLTLVEAKKTQAFSSMLLHLVSSILLVSISLLMSYFIIRELSIHVKDLTAVMTKVRDENDLCVRAKFLDKSEMGQISLALNLTLEKFSGALNVISSSSITLSAAAEETSQTCMQNAKIMTEQQGEIGVIATAIEELSVTVKEVAGNTQLTADSTKEAANLTENGREIVQKSYLSIENLASEIGDLSKRITSLHESSKNITNVVDVIKSVAQQTNLLALNAAIEAARAGDQGRGFAVVADEVRTLAQRTQDSTSEIESFIITLQADANSAFNVIEKSQEMASEAVLNSKNVENALDGITESVSNIFSMTEQVAVAVEEQAAVTQDVAKSVINVEHESVASATGATQISTTAQEQALLAVTLQDIVSAFKI